MVTLGGRKVQRERDAWVYETPGAYVTYREDGVIHGEPVTFGEFKKDGTFVPKLRIDEVPHYTSDTDDALGVKAATLGLREKSGH